MVAEPHLRLAGRDDLLLLWAWRNDPDLRRVSFQKSLVTLEEHTRWLEVRLGEPGTRIFIAELEGRPVGTVRFQPRGDQVILSIAITASERGKGLGEWMLREGTRRYLEEFPVEGVLAETVPDNLASQRALIKSGYTILSRTEDRISLFFRKPTQGAPAMNLRFRKINEDDQEMIRTWRMLPDVTKYMYTDPEITLENQLAWHNKTKIDPSKKYWIINADNEDVGLVGIYDIDRHNRKCEWAYYLASPSVRGKGIGRSVEFNIQDYVFNVLDLNKLCCEVFTWNEAVIGMHEKYGSSIEGTRRDHIFKNGEFFDIVEMGLLRRHWKENIEGRFEYTKAMIDE